MHASYVSKQNLGISAACFFTQTWTEYANIQDVRLCAHTHVYTHVDMHVYAYVHATWPAD